MKKLFSFLVLMIIITVSIFAQEKYGYIKPTFALGYSSIGKQNQRDDFMAVGVDVDFVSNFGLTIGVQNIMLWNPELSMPITSFGIGYTYDDKTNYIYPLRDMRPSFGIKMIGAPLFYGAVGFEISVFRLFTEKTGISAIFDFYYYKDAVKDDSIAFLIKVGYSMKL